MGLWLYSICQKSKRALSGGSPNGESPSTARPKMPNLAGYIRASCSIIAEYIHLVHLTFFLSQILKSNIKSFKATSYSQPFSDLIDIMDPANGSAPLNGHSNGNGHAHVEPAITTVNGPLGIGAASLQGKVALVTGSGT
jgi:hypothetical protein